MQSLIGGGANQLVVNGALGGMAYQDPRAVNIQGGSLTGVVIDGARMSEATRAVATIAELRQLPNTSVLKNVLVLGYYAAGDGGGGVYHLDTADSSTPDDGGATIVAADGGRWKLASLGGVSLRQFGARGDGVSGDSARIQAAFDWASVTGVMLTEESGGTYIIDARLELKSNVHLRGNGLSKFFFPANIDLTGAPSLGGSICAMYALEPCHDITLEGVTFESTTAGVINPIRCVIQGVTRFRVDKCTFQNFGDATHYAQGLVVFGTEDVRITNSKFSGCSGDGLAFGYVKTAYIYGNEFSSNGDFGFAVSDLCSDIHIEGNICNFNTGSAIGTDDASSVTVIGNRMHASFNGFRVARFGTYAADQSHTVVANNVISGSISHGIAIEDTINFVVSGNDVYNSGDKGILVSNSQEGVISGNNVYGSAFEAVLVLVNDSAKYCGNLTITGNNIGHCTYGIRALNTAGHLLPCTISGNPVRVARVAKMEGPFLYDEDAVSDSVDYVHIGARGVNYNGVVSTSSATGGGVTPPAGVQGFLPAYLNGSLVKIPYFNP